jgi:hypothetical protein
MGWCFNCGEKIFFDDNIRNGYGMVIPLDDNGDPHSCRHNNRKIGFGENQKCFRCGENIFFDENYMSISGKHVPLDWATGEPHDCPEWT